jgi:thioredoxin reductase (NADPH)
MTYELIIIGAGPAGISMAAEAIISGIDREKVLVIEKTQEHNFSIRKFYPDQKLVTANYKGQAAMCKGVMCILDSSKNDTLTYLDKAIQDYKINVHYNEAVHKIEKDSEGLFTIGTDKEDYKSKICTIAIGMMGKPNKPNYSFPAGIRSQITFDITSVKLENKKVLVVGGGDSASEYAQYLSQEQNDVSLSYRRDTFSKMNIINSDSLLALSEQGKVNLLLNSNIDSLEQEGESVKVNFKDKDAQTFDHVVYALGGSTPKNFLTLLGIKFKGNEPQVCDGFETSIPGLFLIGDLSAGRKGGSIITAFNSAHDAMKKICTDYLSCTL